MADNHQNTEIQIWRRNIFIIGAAIGGLIGLGAAYLFAQKAEDPDRLPSITTGDGVRLGLLILGLLRSITELGEG